MNSFTTAHDAGADLSGPTTRTGSPTPGRLARIDPDQSGRSHLRISQAMVLLQDHDKFMTRREGGMSSQEPAHEELSDFEWSVIKPLLPNKSRGVARVDDRRVLNGIFWRLRRGAAWNDIPACYGPYTTCANRFYRWRDSGVWTRILHAVAAAYEGNLHLISSAALRTHRHRSGAADDDPVAWLVESVA